MGLLLFPSQPICTSWMVSSQLEAARGPKAWELFCALIAPGERITGRWVPGDPRWEPQGASAEVFHKGKGKGKAVAVSRLHCCVADFEIISQKR